MEGRRLGPYQLHAHLGLGGMGTVYRAEVVGNVPELDPGCSVALKVIHNHLLEAPGFFRRFLREADIGRSVRHDNVVRTYLADALLHEGVQQNFLVMEYVEGQTLRDLLQELERVPEELCRHIGREIAKGLEAIHTAGVVHRDLKPENVLITADHVVKVMDLGVARLQDEAIRLSTAGAFVGSLEYAAPEQFKTADGEPDGRADLHALGVLLYELSTGRHPYRDEDASRVLRRILDEEPRRVGEVNPQLSPFFEEVVHTLIAKERDARFRTASDLAEALEAGEHGTWWKERAKALRRKTRRPLRRIRIARETALYGRDAELARLHAVYEKAAGGAGQVVLVEGEAGIGKSRLVDEFVGRLHQEGEDLNFLFGSYPPGGAATASGAFSTAFREHFGDAALQQILPEYLPTTPLLVPAFAALLRGDATPTGAQALTQESLQTVFIECTRALAAERPTIVLIDDLHFAPAEGRALFAGLATALADQRVLLVGTRRRGLSESWAVGLDRLEHTSRLEVSRLGPKDLVALLRDAFRSERLASELAARIAEKSDGNPFFAFEIIQGLRDSLLIEQQGDGSWISTQAIADIRIPSSVSDLITARVADLSEIERNLLDVAACCGFEFDPGLAGGVLGMPRIAALQAFGHVERAHRLIRSTGRNCVFDHHQIHEVLYGGLLGQLREAYHAAIAEALEAREDAASRDPETLEGDLCHALCVHFLRGAGSERARRYLGPALDHLEDGYLSEQLIDLADRALGVRGFLRGRERLAILLRKNGGLSPLGRSAEQEAVLAEARSLAQAEGDRGLIAGVELALGRFLWATSRYEAAREHTERARALFEGLGNRAGAARAGSVLGNVFIHTDQFDEARKQHERVLAFYREVGDTDGESAAMINLGIVLAYQGEIQEARSHYLRGIELARECGNRAWEANASSNLAGLLIDLGRDEEARTCYEVSLRINQEIGNRRMEGNVLGNYARLMSQLDRLGEALDLHRRARAIHRETGYRGGAAKEDVSMALLWHRLGRIGQARELSEQALATARELNMPSDVCVALIELAMVAEEEGDLDRAVRLARESLSIRREIQHGAGVASDLSVLGGLLVDQGRHEEAAPLLTEALQTARDLDLPAQEMSVRCRQALIPPGDAGPVLEAFEALGERLSPATRRNVRWLLFRVTGEPAHLAEAKRLLDDRVRHAPEAHRASMRENVRLNREIEEAWRARGVGA